MEDKQKKPELFGLNQDEWVVVAKAAVTAATVAFTTIKATKK